MKHFAVESGKSKGQFYTPAEVSRIMARVIGAHKATGRTQTVCDSTCGSGSLLLKVAAETPNGIAIYGQELDNATAALAAMNMWLHGEPTAEIKRGQSTLANPLFLSKDGALKTFDYAVANPPFSTKAWQTGFDPEHDQYERFTGATTHGQATRCVDSMAHLGSPKCASQVPDSAIAPAASVRDRGDGRW